ncbi:MAG: hypothetical protein K1X92_06565 [Bacteroidia bacterium]|nr:hypothetical protein [Bacteroidia bacterium]
MKTKFFSIAFLFSLMFLSTNVNAQELYFYVVNNTGLTLNAVHVSPAESEKWHDDTLPTLFEDGMEIKVTVPAEFGESCMFDMQITDLSGHGVIFPNFDACKLLRITLLDDQGHYTIENE